jgi:hypothetical protein
LLSFDGGQLTVEKHKSKYLFTMFGEHYKGLTKKQTIKLMDFLKQQIESEKK